MHRVFDWLKEYWLIVVFCIAAIIVLASCEGMFQEDSYIVKTLADGTTVVISEVDK